jgi:3-hydroxyisobutyrate dehydrogenase-like beta-hydroxyacid dehydrogenase
VSARAEIAAVAIVGFGELGEALARVLRDAGRAAPRAFNRPRAAPADADALRRRMEAAGAEPAATLKSALAGAELVLVCVPGAASREIADRARAVLAPGALYADLATASGEDKETAAEVIAGAGGRYVDAAVLGAVAAAGARVPILAAGAGAFSFAEAGAGFGLAVTPLQAPAGAAARVKLLRSVYLKGRDALIAEMLLAARRHDVEQVVADSIQGPGEEVPFPALADRVLTSLALHAGRRADELRSSAALLRASGVEAAVTEGAVLRLQLLAEVGLAERFGGVRPTDATQVLDEFERRSGR